MTDNTEFNPITQSNPYLSIPTHPLCTQSPPLDENEATIMTSNRSKARQTTNYQNIVGPPKITKFVIPPTRPLFDTRHRDTDTVARAQ